MSDREKIIQRLEECLTASCRGFRTCPYSDTEWDAVETALALLREHEPKTVELIQIDRSGKWGADLIGYCPSCKRLLNSRFSNRFCGECGQAVTWND